MPDSLAAKLLGRRLLKRNLHVLPKRHFWITEEWNTGSCEHCHPALLLQSSNCLRGREIGSPSSPMRQDTVIIKFHMLLSLTALCRSITPLSSIAESGSTAWSFPWTIYHRMTVDSADQGIINRQSWNPAWVAEGMRGGGIKPQGPWPEITAGTWPSPSVPHFSILASVHRVNCNSFLAGTPFLLSCTHSSPHHG